MWHHALADVLLREPVRRGTDQPEHLVDVERVIGRAVDTHRHRSAGDADSSARPVHDRHRRCRVHGGRRALRRAGQEPSEGEEQAARRARSGEDDALPAHRPGLRHGRDDEEGGREVVGAEQVRAPRRLGARTTQADGTVGGRQRGRRSRRDQADDAPVGLFGPYRLRQFGVAAGKRCVDRETRRVVGITAGDEGAQSGSLRGRQHLVGAGAQRTVVVFEHTVRLDEETVDAVQHAQCRGIERDHAAVGERSSELGRERFASQPARLGETGVQRGDGAIHPPGDGEREPEPGEGSEPRAIGVRLDRATRHRAGSWVGRGWRDAPSRRFLAQLGLASLPCAPAGDELAVERHAVSDVDDRPERPLREALSDRVRDTQAQVGERGADPTLDEATYPRGSLDDRHQRGDVDLDGQGAEPARPADERDAEADDVGAQREEVAHDWLVVTRVLRTFGAESVAVGAAFGFSLFEHLFQLVGRDDALVVRHHDPQEIRVDLRPVDRVDPGQGFLDAPPVVGRIRRRDLPQLEMDATGRAPPPAGAPQRKQPKRGEPVERAHRTRIAAAPLGS